MSEENPKIDPVSAIAKITAPVIKLMEVIEKGVGRWYKPIGMRREGKAEAENHKLMAEAEAYQAVLQAKATSTIKSNAQEAEFTLEDRVLARITYQELQRQGNLENIINSAPNYLPDEVSEEPVDPDWRTRFFNKAQDVTNEELQKIWSRILAKEVEKPGSVSIRTLEIVSNLTKDEALLFEKACRYCTMNIGIFFCDSDRDYNEIGLSFAEISLLREVMLFRYGENTILHIEKDNLDKDVVLGKDTYEIGFKNEKQKSEQFGVALFTNAGLELFNLVDIEFDQEYKQKVLDFWESKGLALKMKS